MNVKLTDLPALPPMAILEETPEEVYRRWVNRAITLAQEKGLPPPPTDPGEYFYDLWYPIAMEYSEQQELLTYAFLQGFPIWADGEFLDGHGWSDGMPRKVGEDDDTYRLRMLERAFTEEGSGRRKDYETWAKELEGVGGAVAVEKARSDVSIDLYLTDLQGKPVTEEFAAKVKAAMWESKRIAGHDLAVHPAPVFTLKVEAQLNTALSLTELVEPIRKRIADYALGRTKLVFNYVGAALLVKGVEDYENLTLNGATKDVEVPVTSVLKIEVSLT
ncbi:baseplate J/gp47 family protein [Paenibacillus sp. EKM202P]|uniref:baseplate J/gp47 family protein n=1 Tax=unclassified Paenibacillus TaxID=185978 RepID=UPI0013ED82FB|nr:MULTISPECIES: baseplate J/gp47 family protein [unclassified Paenibacillus]KAF6561993.1 baseplate J/gp47 family protein [Paenibacillus sp. EKM202P]KAF6566281.1 baseplate J/gp47 family protein [Paenibacillus sp. EKM207P]